MRRFLLALALLFFTTPVFAQVITYTGIQNLNLVQNVSQYISFAADTVANPWVTLVNLGSSDIHYHVGAGVVFAQSTDAIVPVNGCISIQVGQSVNIAFLATQSPSSIRILQSAVQGSCTLNGANNVDASANPPSLVGLNLLGTLYPNVTRRGYMVQVQDTQADCGGSQGNSNGVIVAFDDDKTGTPTISILNFASSRYGGDGGEVDMSGMPHTGRIRYYGTAGCTVGAAQW